MPLKRSNTKRVRAPLLAVGVGVDTLATKSLKPLLSHLKWAENFSVIIQSSSLKEDSKSHESLKAMTKLPVQLITKGLRFQAGHVYLSPPGQFVSVEKNIFKLKAFKTPAASKKSDKLSDKTNPIDYLFRSLAVSHGASGVAVVLSGEGGDGAQGLFAVNEAGGFTLVQSPQSSLQKSMPQSAMDTGAVDYELPPEKIAAEIITYAKYLQEMSSGKGQTQLKEQITASLHSISEILLRETHQDFKHYKSSTMVRRILRRMQVLQLGQISDYVERLEKKPEEARLLFHELLINVTTFFRDPEAFMSLKQDVLEPLFKENTGKKVRIWVAGCSTGEEAYSFAIYASEIAAKMKNPPQIQILATDIDEHALSTARKGAYPTSIASKIPAQMLERYFTRRGGRYHVSKELREMCLFSLHNLINDPPFSQIDLISCRNLLIYVGSHLQKKLFPVFHYSLKPGGYLFLGTSESLTPHRELFKAVNAKHRIGQRKNIPLKNSAHLNRSMANFTAPHPDSGNKNQTVDINQVSQRIALDELASRHAVVNDTGQLVSTSPGISKYLDINDGPFHNNIVKMVKPSLRGPLRSTFNLAKKHMRKAVLENCLLKVEDQVERVGLIVQPMPQLGEETGLFWVAFQYLGKVPNPKATEKSKNIGVDSEVVEQLENELAVLREELDKSVQDLEASNEELKSSNEELLSMNEELQSANEELESSKEEIQGSNEALQRANLDLENLLASTNIATIFLDEEMQIRGFTPAIADIYRVQASDIGREITDFTSRALTMPAYPEQGYFNENTEHESSIRLQDGRVFLRRIRPYMNSDQGREGLVVTFIDVTALRETQESLHQTVEQMQLAVRSGRLGTFVFNYDTLKSEWSELTHTLFGVHDKYPNATREDLHKNIHPDDIEKVLKTIQGSVNSSEGFRVEFRVNVPELGERWLREFGRIYISKQNERIVYGTVQDVTDEKLLQINFEKNVDGSPAILWITESDGSCTYLSNRWYDFTGQTEKEALGFGWLTAVHPDDREAAQDAFIQANANRVPFSLEHRLRLATGDYRWVTDAGNPRFDDDGHFLGYAGAVTDIHETKLANEQLRLSELRFREFAEAMPQMAFFADSSGEITYYNRRWYEYIGNVKSTEGSGWKDQPVHHPDDLERTIKSWSDSIMTGSNYEIEYRLRRADGEYRWHLGRAIPVRDEVGKIISWFGTNTDISAIKIAESRIAESEARLQLALYSGNIGFWDWNAQTGYCFLSDTLMTDWGVDPETYGNTLDEVMSYVHPSDRERIWGEIRAATFAGKQYDVEYRVVRPNSEVIWINAKGRLIMDANGNPEKLTGVSINISERKKITQEVQLAKEEAERANLAKTVFLANMSHEIRTPLTAVLGFAELMKQNINRDDQNYSHLDRLASNASLLGRLIDELLDLSKIEADRLEIEKRQIDPVQIFEDVLTTVSLRAQEKDLAIALTGLEQLPDEIYSDPQRLRQILVNVLGNAVKFTSKGTINVHVEVIHKSFDRGSQIRISVRDTGIGMSSDQQNRIFQPFMQGDASVTRKYGGTGLGLALSKRLALLLGGDLTLKSSREGFGSEFLIEIDITKPENLQVPSKAKLSVAPAQDLSGKKILIVDDSADNRVIVSLFLKPTGAEIHTANDGREAVEQATAGSFDLILMDIQMPILDGYGALAELKKAGNKTPVIALTAHAFKEEVDRCLAAGFASYLSKPITKDVLRKQVIKTLLKQ